MASKKVEIKRISSVSGQVTSVSSVSPSLLSSSNNTLKMKQ